MTLNFDEWMELARQDPAAFERQRGQAIEELILQSPPQMQQKLQCLQWRIDMERNRSKNAMEACTRVYSMMWNRVYDHDGLLDKLSLLLKVNDAATAATISTPPKSAKILAFRS